MTTWNNTTVAESAWEMITLVKEAQKSSPLLAEGEPEGVLFSAIEDLVGFATRNPDVMPAWLHERYSKFLIGKGFKWEATTSASDKTSRALVSWGELGPSEKTEYAIFMGVLSIITKGPSKKSTKKAPVKRQRKKADEGAALEAAAAAEEESVVI